MNLLALVVLALVDAAFAGFRAAAGRDPRIYKWRPPRGGDGGPTARPPGGRDAPRTAGLACSGYYPRAIRAGALGGAVALLLPVGVGAALWLGSGQALAPWWAALDEAARPMVGVLGVFTVLVVGAFAPWRLAGSELRTFISVTVFGPLTLLRPVVVLVALGWALLHRPGLGAGLTLAVGAAAVLLVEPWLDRQRRAGARPPT